MGTPKDIYDKSENLFIATFIGKGALIEVMVDEVGDTIRVNIGGSFLEGVNTCNTLEGVIDWSARKTTTPLTEAVQVYPVKQEASLRVWR